MRSSGNWAAVAIATAVAGAVASCGAEPDVTELQAAMAVGEELSSCVPGSSVCVDVQPFPAMKDACPEDRWVALRQASDSVCPTPAWTPSGVWTRELLFDPADASTVGSGLPVPLRRFCLYQWRPVIPGAAPVTSVLLAMNVSDLDPDCRVVGLQGTTAVDDNWKELRRAYLTQVGALPLLPMSVVSSPATIRVAVVDAAPEQRLAGEAIVDRSGHGFAVGRIVRELGCPEAPGSACVAQVTSHLVLPQVDARTADWVMGGFFGTQGQLAQGVGRAVRAFAEDDAAGVAEEHLVVSLSVGWDPHFGGGFSGSDPMVLPQVPVLAVYEAILWARCRGALVIAAAGNDPGGPAAKGPVYPAAWETKRAPTSAECVPFASGPSFVAPPGAPLLYSAGGVGAADEPLSIGRRLGRPRLAAAASHAVMTGAGLAERTSVLTGTSMAAAAASATAAVVWGYRPGLTADGVMDAVRDASVPLGVLADYCPAGRCVLPDGEVRRLDLCAAVAAACAAGGVGCAPGAIACTVRPAFVSAAPKLSPASLEPRTPDERSPLAVPRFDLAAPSVCDVSKVDHDEVKMPAVPCPQRQYYNGAVIPWTLPQPGSNPCPLCSAVKMKSVASADLFIEIDSGYAGELSDPVLWIDGYGDLTLPDLVLTAGERHVISGVPIAAGIGQRLTLSFTIRDAAGVVRGSATAPVMAP